MKNISLIIEGGAYGHLHHPFETDINLTFGQLKSIINDAMTGKLEMVTEKTDGMQLSVSWKNETVIAARNKSHLKNEGESAMKLDDIVKEFTGRGAIQEAFKFAVIDLTSAFKSITPETLASIFKNGKRFMSLEIIYPKAINVIPYGQSLLVFHDLIEYDKAGNPIGSDAKYAITLAKLIAKVNANTQSTFNISGPPIVSLPSVDDMDSKKKKYINKLTKLQKQFKLSDDDGVVAYHAAWWSDWIKQHAPTPIKKEQIEKLVSRWVYNDRTFKLSDVTDDDTLSKWIKSVDSVDHRTITRKNLRKFEDIFLGVGSDILGVMKSVLTVNHSKAVADIRKRIDSTISAIQSSDDPAKINKLKIELERLNALGGWESIVPIEGIVFKGPDGNMLKLTGKFSPINQILGLMYGKK